MQLKIMYNQVENFHFHCLWELILAHKNLQTHDHLQQNITNNTDLHVIRKSTWKNKLKGDSPLIYEHYELFTVLPLDWISLS